MFRLLIVTIFRKEFFELYTYYLPEDGHNSWPKHVAGYLYVHMLVISRKKSLQRGQESFKIDQILSKSICWLRVIYEDRLKPPVNDFKNQQNIHFCRTFPAKICINRAPLNAPT
jgi:hypothetical protein